MKNKYIFTAVMLLAILAAGLGLTGLYVRYGKNSPGEEQFTVVTSFYPMYIAARNVIGECEGVVLENLSEPQSGCLHDYQLTAGDMRRLSAADLFIVNGGGIESFLADVAGQYPGLTLVNACDRLQLLDDNAHVWMSIADHMIQVQTIADGLSAADPAHADAYQANCTGYLEKLEQLRKRQQETAQAAPAQDVILFHEAYAYLARDYGLGVSACVDLDEERQVSAGEVADVVGRVRSGQVRLILAEELYGSQLGDTVKKETQADVIYLDTCVRGTYQADSYLKAMDENLTLMQQALEAGE